MTPLLEVNNISKSFGGIKALTNVSLNINQGEILGLIGPNGSGKTTLFNIITGFYQCDNGKVLFKGKDITGQSPHIIAQKGVVQTFQHLALWSNFSVFNNVRIALLMKSGLNIFGSLLNTTSYRRMKKKIAEEVMEILQFVGMEQRRDQLADTLSHGYQRTLSLAIGLAKRSPLLLLDEPVTALNPERVKHIMSLLNRLREQGSSILIIEHNMRAIFKTCDRIVVLNTGNNLAEGTPPEIRENKDVIAAYLGGVSDAEY
ncbi:ABC transporter ATP-binding protein [Thermodesulfobacteriota bacterium]